MSPSDSRNHDEMPAHSQEVAAMHPLKQTARIAGFLYLLVVLTGFFTLMYVPGKLFVPGSATATASNILAHQSLFRTYIAVEILSMVFFIATVLAPAALISQVFWGLWLFPLGVLTYRSGFMPRILGIWLIINGLAYVMLSAIGLLWPDYPKMILTIAMPVLFGEVAFTLWLLVVGVRVPPASVAEA
jgi:hypothetical protein